MEKPDNKEGEDLFKNSSAEYVFGEITSKIDRSDLRALWSRLQNEIERQGIGGSTTYLETEFGRLKQELSRALSQVEPD